MKLWEKLIMNSLSANTSQNLAINPVINQNKLINMMSIRSYQIG